MDEQDVGPEHEELRNTLYRKVKRGKRRLTRGRMLAYRIAVAVAYRRAFGAMAWAKKHYALIIRLGGSRLVVLGVLMSTGVGVFFGSYPAARASRLDPIEALRYE